MDVREIGFSIRFRNLHENDEKIISQHLKGNFNKMFHKQQKFHEKFGQLVDITKHYSDEFDCDSRKCEINVEIEFYKSDFFQI